jgi:hypothetical protein
MQVATVPSFTERLCAAYDLEHPHRDPDARVRRSEVVEYIAAFSVDKRPYHPTSAIAWDLQRTFGESEGRRLLLRASRQWDAKPLRARDIVHRWWDDDYEPQAWVDEYLVEAIDDWRSERGRLQLCADAEREWLAFNGVASMQRFNAWHERYGAWYLDPEGKLGPVKVVSNRQARFAEDLRAGRIPYPSAPKEPPQPAATAERRGFGGYTMPSRSKFRRK